MPNIYKMSNAGGVKSLVRYHDMLAGNTVWNPYTPQGSVFEISKTTLTSAVASVIIPVPTGFRHLQVQLTARSSGTGGSFINMKINADTNSSNYSRHLLYGDGTSAASASSFNMPSAAITNLGKIPDASNSANIFGGFIVDITEYANIAKNKVSRSFGGYDANGSGEVDFNGCNWINTSSITSLTFTEYSSANITAGSTFTLLGIK